MLAKGQLPVEDMNIHVVISDQNGQTLFDSSSYIQTLLVEVYDNLGNLIFSSWEYFTQRNQKLLIAKEDTNEHNRTSEDTQVKHECEVSNNFADVIAEFTFSKNEIATVQNETGEENDTRKGTRSEKNNFVNILKGDLINNERCNITDLVQSETAKIQKADLINNERCNITDLAQSVTAKIQKSDLINNGRCNITDLVQTNKTFGDNKKTTIKINVHDIHHQKSEESDMKNEIKDFCSAPIITSVDYKKAAIVDVSLTSEEEEAICCNKDQINCVKNKTKAGKQSLSSTPNVKETTLSDDSLKCEICKIVYKSEVMLNKHKRRHTTECTNGTNSLQCPICKKTYPNWKSLTIHKRKHTATRDQVCETCGKGFRTKQELVRHEFVHTNAKSSPCHVCGKLFKNKAYAQMHSKLHSVENRKYVCILCGKHFLRGPDIQKHMRIHTGEKPFICSHCGRSFCESSHLIRHERLHTGEKPYKCDKCDLTFTHKEVLLRHSFTHVKCLPFSCEICHKGFKTKRELNHHCAIHDKSLSSSCALPAVVGADATPQIMIPGCLEQLS